jgi:hypothetical protein
MRSPKVKQAVEFIREVIAPFADRYLYEACLELLPENRTLTEATI